MSTFTFTSSLFFTLLLSLSTKSTRSATASLRSALAPPPHIGTFLPTASDNKSMADPRTYSLALEDAVGRRQLRDGYEPVREAYTSVGRHGVGTDRYKVDFQRPTVNMRTIDAGDLHERLINGWRRLGDNFRQQYAFQPKDNFYPASLARATGRPTEGVGVTGTLVTDEMRPELGGGYFLQTAHLPPMHRLSTTKKMNPFQ